MDVFTLVAKLTLDSAEFDSKLGGAKEKASGLGGAIAGAVNIGAKAFGAVTAAAGGFAASAVKAGSDFDTAMSQVQATMLKTNEEMEKSIGSVDTAYGHFSGNLREFAQFLGANTAFSATQAAEALNFMALAGYDTQESMDMLPNVLSLAAAGAMDLALASDMVTDTQTAFGINAERTTQLVDEMAKAASTGNTNVQQLGEAFLVVGGLAQELNGGIVNLSDGTEATVDGVQELEIALTAMANAGIKGSEAGTHMRNMIMKLSNPTKDGAATMEALGLKVFDAEGHMRSFGDIMSDLGNSMSELTQEEKINAISDLFNSRDLASAEALLNAVQYDMGALGEAVKATGINLDSYLNREDIVQRGIDFSAVVGYATSALGEYGTVQEAAANLADVYSMNMGDALTVTQAISDKLPEAASSWDKIGESILQAKGSAAEMANIQLDNLTGDMTLFKSALEGAQIALSDKLTPYLRDFVQEGTKGLGALQEAFETGNFDNVIDVLTESFTMLVNSLLESTPQFLEVGAKILGSLAQGIINNGPQILTTASTILQNLVNGITEGLPIMASAAVNILGSLTQGITQNLPQLIATGLQTLMDFSGSLRENVGLIVDAGLELIMALAESLIDNLPVIIQTVPTIVSNIAGIINDNAPKLLASGIVLIGKLAAGVIQSIPVIVQEFPKILKMIADVITAFNWIQLGTHIITFIKNGVTSLASDIPSKLRDIAHQGVDFVKNVDWKSLGSNIINFIVNGIQSLVQSIPDALKAIAKTAVDAVKAIDWVDLGIGIVSGIANGIKNGASSVIGAIGGVVGGAIEKGKSMLKINSPSKVFAYYGKMVDEGFALGISDNASMVDKTLADLMDISAPSINMGAMSGNGYSGGNIEVNVYGAQGQDVRELADIVVDEIDRRIRSRQEVYA